MTKYWVVTSGKGTLPAGQRVGHIEAKNKSIAHKLLEPQIVTPHHFNLKEVNNG